MGSVMTMRKEFAGGIFGGDADYGVLKYGARFFQTYDAMEQVLTISGKFGTLGKFENGKDADVPFFDRFFMGSLQFKRMGLQEAGPLFERTDEPEGGNSLSYATLEYTFKLADPLRFALFYDGGFPILDSR